MRTGNHHCNQEVSQAMNLKIGQLSRLVHKPLGVIFDLSGTLVNSLHRGDRDVLDEICYKYSGKSYLQAREVKDHQRSLKYNFNLFFGDKAPKAHQEYMDKLIAAIPLSELFPSVQETLALLKKNNIKTAVISNRPKSYLDAALSHFKLCDVFDSVVSGDKMQNCEKPDAAIIDLALNELHLTEAPRDAIVMVGDSSVDVECADNAGIVPILFSDRDLNTEWIKNRCQDKSKKELILAADYNQLKDILFLQI